MYFLDFTWCWIPCWLPAQRRKNQQNTPTTPGVCMPATADCQLMRRSRERQKCTLRAGQLLKRKEFHWVLGMWDVTSIMYGMVFFWQLIEWLQFFVKTSILRMFPLKKRWNPNGKHLFFLVGFFCHKRLVPIFEFLSKVAKRKTAWQWSYCNFWVWY